MSEGAELVDTVGSSSLGGYRTLFVSVACAELQYPAQSA